MPCKKGTWQCRHSPCSAAVALATYLNLDAIDGKQARRTGTQGPLGELFDHGCDAINLLLTCITVPHGAGIPLTSTTALLLYAMTGMLVFFLATLEEWHTGTLYLGVVSGPVEGAWAMVLVSMGSALHG